MSLGITEVGHGVGSVSSDTINGMRFSRLALAGAGFVVIALVFAACSSAGPASSQSTGEEDSTTAEAAAIAANSTRYVLQQVPELTITLTSTSIKESNGRLDREHTCERFDASPDLSWEGVPDGAASLALVMEDPKSDVHGLTIDVLWAHWVLYSIPPEVTELTAEQPAGDTLDNGATQGVNDYDRVQYNGPCPMPNLRFQRVVSAGGRPGRPPINAEERPYFFRLYALDSEVDLAPGFDRDTLLQAIDGHVLAAGELAIPYKSAVSRPCLHDVEPCIEGVLQQRN